MYKAEEIKFTAGEKVCKVSGLLILPKGAHALLVLAHGAGLLAYDEANFFLGDVAHV